MSTHRNRKTPEWENDHGNTVTNYFPIIYENHPNPNFHKLRDPLQCRQEEGFATATHPKNRRP